jgi:hypothetical protein
LVCDYSVFAKTFNPGSIGRTLFKTIKGLMTIGKIDILNLEVLCSDGYTKSKELKAIYYLVDTYRRDVKVNKAIFDEKCIEFGEANTSFVWAFGFVGANNKPC